MKPKQIKNFPVIDTKRGMIVNEQNLSILAKKHYKIIVTNFHCYLLVHIRTSGVVLKVSKSQKQFFLRPKNEILDKILLYEAKAEFCKILFEQWSVKKKGL